MGKKFTKEQLNKKVLYFAYGSNMYQPRLEQRVGKVLRVGVYNLQNFKLTFDAGCEVSYANIAIAENDHCEGVVYEMTYAQLLMLDKYEMLYARNNVDYNGRKLHYYISRYKCRTQPRITRDYYELLVLGCRRNNLLKSLALINEQEDNLIDSYNYGMIYG